MIEILQGNIFEAKTVALVNPVNCVGIMGRGLALQFKNTFPENFEAYRIACGRHKVILGNMFVYEVPPSRYDLPRYIFNFPTKQHWGDKSTLEIIEKGLEALMSEVYDRNMKSIAIPALGCGLGGLDWKDVRPRIQHAFRMLLATRVLLYEPEKKKS